MTGSKNDIEKIKRNKIVLEELNMLHNQGVELIEPNDISGSFRDRDNLYNHIESLIKGAKKSVTIITTTKGLIRRSPAMDPMYPNATPYPETIPTLEWRETVGSMPL